MNNNNNNNNWGYNPNHNHHHDHHHHDHHHHECHHHECHPHHDHHCDRHEENCWQQCIDLSDHGPCPYVVNITEATIQNTNYRTALWTGTHLQLTLMSINPREDIGLEIHYNWDQFLRVEQGQGLVLMGNREDNLYFQRQVHDDDVIFIPAGTWHNVINTGCVPLKLYSIYAPPAHPHGTVHRTKEDAEEAEEHYGY